MTSQDWKKVKLNWGSALRIRILADNYTITLQLSRNGMQLRYGVYVNGEFRGAWVLKDPVEGYCDIAKRFLNLHKKGIYSNKDLEEFRKAFGKNNKRAQQKFYEYIIPFWTSFTAFKSHLIANNKNIELIEII